MPQEKMKFYTSEQMTERIGLCYNEVEKLRQRNASLRAREIINALDTIVKVMDDLFVYFNLDKE